MKLVFEETLTGQPVLFLSLLASGSLGQRKARLWGLLPLTQEEHMVLLGQRSWQQEGREGRVKEGEEQRQEQDRWWFALAPERGRPACSEQAPLFPPRRAGF